MIGPVMMLQSLEPLGGTVIFGTDHVGTIIIGTTLLQFRLQNLPVYGLCWEI